MKLKLSLVCLMTYGGALMAQTSDRPDLFYKVGQGISGQISLAAGQRRGRIGYQVGLFNNSQPGMRDLNEGPPSLDARFLGNYAKSSTFGFDGLYFFGPRDRNFHVGFGLYDVGTDAIWRSPSTGQLYNLGGREVYRGAFSVGFSAAVSPRVELGLGYHTLLGWNLSYTMRSR